MSRCILVMWYVHLNSSQDDYAKEQAPESLNHEKNTTVDYRNINFNFKVACSTCPLNLQGNLGLK